MPAGAAAEASAAVGPEARVALAEVYLAGRGVAAPGLELPGRGRDAVGARLGVEVPHALRHGLHGARSPGAVPSALRRRRGHERAERRVPHGHPAGVPRRAAALLEQHGRVLLPQERVVPVADETGAQLHGAAGGPGAEGGEPGDGGADAAGADGGREVGAALVEADEGGVRWGGEVGVGGVGRAVGDRGEHGVHTRGVLGGGGVAPLRAPGVHERRVVVGAAVRARQEQQREDDGEERCCGDARGHALLCFPARVALSGQA
uniref:Uncharacterized protein n=1 Tax=Setaria italica TaxID=4555 RepID=K3YV28_SETIT